MFETLTRNLTKVFDYLKSSGTLSPEQIDTAMRDIRIALLEADVAISVVKEFINIVKTKALGQEIIKSVAPGQMIVKIIHDELINILSAPTDRAKLNTHGVLPINILMVGLQGSGKTTASAKLALKLKNLNKKVLLVSLDPYRPAAQEQLEILGTSIGVDSLPINQKENPLETTKRALTEARLSAYEVVIYDTAGRIHLNDEKMNEVADIKKLVNPIETLLVVDSTIGQDAVNVAKSFDQILDITGVILSRIDGDSRGGAALSIRHATGKPIKFLSAGEKLPTLEEFDPKRLASRILDMGDIVSFVEKAASVIDKEEAEKTALKLQKGKFDLNDYLTQIRSIKKLGGIGGMLGMLPGISRLKDKIDQTKISEKLLSHQEAIILSMSKAERKNPDLMNASRRRRVAIGSGTSVQQVNILLKQFKQINDVMKKTKGMDSKSLMRSGIGKLFS